MEKLDIWLYVIRHFSILIDGSPKGFFGVSRGLHQGNFVGFQVGANGLSVSHLQYADDTLIFCQANADQVSNIARFLNYCEVAMGLKVNFNKTSLIGINCKEELVKELADAFGV
ncbi:uncharacterized protein LOC105421345 [Amborella trichopoda]|uniref:uncharacterized protein LOC105421345 n=1 Tax=Amborella trichopoda TaxID=13333 RepID=UPI0005D3C6AB|nr:uncharacterized protein LOC105421345 [Amborella trichopoda]|eukprot:XP_011626699.1 uncharacterized protein LOC105421345 [Amborella trichopoda]